VLKLMLDVFAFLAFFLCHLGFLVWMLATKRTIGHGLWRPSVTQREAPRQFWSELIGTGLFALFGLGLLIQAVRT
jgi:hypothetical protein